MKNYEIKAKFAVGDEKFVELKDQIYIVEAENLYEALLYVKQQEGYVEMISAKPSTYHIIDTGFYCFFCVITKHTDDAGREHKLKHLIREWEVKKAVARGLALFSNNGVFSINVCGVVETDVYAVVRTTPSMFDGVTEEQKQAAKEIEKEIEQMQIEFNEKED